MSNVCEILSVGTELLLGDIVNTDTAFIAGRLAALGLPTYRQTVVGDNDGVIIVPADIADEVADEATEMTAYEDFVTEKVAEGRSILGLYPATDEKNLAEFAEWRRAKGR